MHANHSTPDAIDLSTGAPVALVLGNLDVVLVVLALAPALALGAPCAGAARRWRRVGAPARPAARRPPSRQPCQPRASPGSGLNLVDAFGRIWLLAGAIVLAGVVGGRADGLTAASSIFCAYSVAFALRLVQGRPEGRCSERGDGHAAGPAGHRLLAEKAPMSRGRKILYTVVGLWLGGIVLFAILFGVTAHKAPSVANNVF